MKYAPDLTRRMVVIEDRFIHGARLAAKGACTTLCIKQRQTERFNFRRCEAFTCFHTHVKSSAIRPPSERYGVSTNHMTSGYFSDRRVSRVLPALR